MQYFIIFGLIMLLAAAVTAVLLRSAYERSHPVLTEYRVESDRLPGSFSGKRILFLSDLHSAVFPDRNKVLYDLIEKAAPDYILIGGDMMTVKEWAEEDYSALELLLKKTAGRCPIYYASGNHEDRMKNMPEVFPGWYDHFLSLLAAYGVNYLDGKSTVIREGRDRIYLYDLIVEKKYYKHKFTHLPFAPGYVKKKLGKAAKGYRIVLCHHPGYLKEITEWGADLVLSGHFHGGTIRLPLVGGLMTPQFQFFSKCARGMLKSGDTREIVSAGLGTHTINIRFMNRPEVILITLTRKENA